MLLEGKPQVDASRPFGSVVLGYLLRNSVERMPFAGVSALVGASKRASRTNLVDPASSHMLVSKIKPCMSQYKLLYGETANGLLKQL